VGRKSRTGDSDGSVDTFEQRRYVLRLYIAGVSLRSSHAIANIKKICEEHLKGRYELEVIDIYQNPDLAKSAQVIAAPTLIKSLPPPLRKFIGDLHDTERILIGLDLKLKKEL
jgi:circadian clock protein KaiB